MADIEKVIKGLEHCGNGIKCETCPYHDENYYPDEYSTSCNDLLCRDALELLKEQQPRAVKNVHYFGDVALGDCPSCGERVLKASCPNFCGKCGDRIDWTKASECEKNCLT